MNLETYVKMLGIACKSFNYLYHNGLPDDVQVLSIDNNKVHLKIKNIEEFSQKFGNPEITYTQYKRYEWNIDGVTFIALRDHEE